MAKIYSLENPPIIEAVLDIDCDLKEPIKFDKVEKPLKRELAKSYPQLRQQFFQEHQFEAKVNEAAKVSVKGGIIGLLFSKTDHKQVVQFRAQGFSFNRLAPYTSFDSYLPQIKKLWVLYIKHACPVSVRQIRLRYINRILVPLVDSKVNLDQYISNAPSVVDSERLTMVGFVNQYVAVDKKNGHQVNSVLASQPPEGDKLPIIFDNNALCNDSGEPDDWHWIKSKILELRELKNDVFWKTVSEECLNLFQQR